MLCRKCKKELPEGSAFCCYCGVKQTPPSKAGRRGNGQGTAVKRGSTWTAIWTLGFAVQDGKLKQKRGSKGGFKTKKEALGNIATSVIQTVMRHAKFSTTQRYIHPDRSAALAAVNQMTDGKKSDDVSGSETA